MRPLLFLFALALIAQDHVPGRLLVKPKPNETRANIQALIRSQQAEVEREIPEIRVLVLKVPEQARDRVAEALTRSNRFEYVEPDYIGKPHAVVPNDPLYPNQWHLGRIGAPQAWAITKGSAQIPIAILDSGVDGTHPDLNGKLLSGWNIQTNTTDTHDVGCYVGHGTATAGTAAAIGGNGVGIASVAWLNPIIPVAGVWGTPTTCFGSYSGWAIAMNWAVNHGARVMSLSGGGFTSSATLQSAVDYAWSKGVLLVASAGNEANANPVYPAATNHVIGVAATTQADTAASFSSYGSWIFLSAPGTPIYTTQKGGTYGNWWGTSFSAPMVAGAVALLISAKPTLTPQQIRDLLKQNADDLGPAGFDIHFGWGRVNIGRALAAAATQPFTPTCNVAAQSSSGAASATCTATGLRIP